MVTVVCDTCVVYVNAAVDYGNVFVNTHGYCVVNNSCYFYAYAVIACHRYFQCSCCAFFCSGCFHFQTCDFQGFCACIVTEFKCDFIIIVFVACQCAHFVFACAAAIYHGVAVYDKFKTAVEFQCQCIVSVTCECAAYGRFDCDILQCCNFFHCYIYSIFYRYGNAFRFDGSIYQIIAICDYHIIRVYADGYFCVFGCSCQLGSQHIGQYPTTFHFTCQCKGQFIYIVYCHITDGDYIAGSVFQYIITTVCEDILTSIVRFINTTKIISACCQGVSAVVVFQIDQTCQVFFCCAAADNIAVIVQKFCFIQCHFDFRIRHAAAAVVCCGKCQLQFWCIININLTICTLHFVFGVVFTANNFGSGFHVASGCKCCCRQQGRCHHRRHG